MLLCAISYFTGTGKFNNSSARLRLEFAKSGQIQTDSYRLLAVVRGLETREWYGMVWYGMVWYGAGV